MGYERYGGDYEDKKGLSTYLLALIHSARMQRTNFENQWEEAASLIWPEWRHSFSLGHVRAPGVKYGQYQITTAGSLSAYRFMSICDMMLTPFNMVWSRVSTDNEYLLKQRDAKIYFDRWTDVLWAERYRPSANFHGQQQINWHSLGVFGNHYMLTDMLDPMPGEPRGLRYTSCAVGEIYRLMNHQNRMDGYIRHFRWTARQAAQRWGDVISGDLKSALSRADVSTMFDFLEFVLPRNDYDPFQPFSPRGKPYISVYMAYNYADILEESGYDGPMPLAAGGYITAPEEWYDRGPAQMALADLKTDNAMEESELRAAVEAGNPMRLVAEDGLFDFKYEAGKNVLGGMSMDGKPLVANLAGGSYQTTVEAQQKIERRIDSHFLIDLFPLLFGREEQQRQHSPREVIEMANQAVIFLAPALGKQFSYLWPMVRREMHLIQRMGKAPEMPPVVREARGDFKMIPSGPLGMALHGQEVAGFWRTHEMLTQMAQATGDPSVYDVLDYNTATPEIAEYQHVPTRWTSSPQMMQRKAQGRAQSAERLRQTQELPGRAAIMKAQAISDKAAAGQNIGGTLSGMAPGGMPLLPPPARGA